MPLDAGTVSVGVEPDLSRFGAKLSTGINAAVGQVERGLSTKLKSLGGQLSSVGTSLTKGLTLPIVGVGAVAVKSAVDFEKAFAGVEKTVEGTTEQFAALSKGLREMAVATGTNAGQLTAIAEDAGALGIATEDILQFVDVVNKLDIATKLTAEGAGTALGKLKNVLDLSVDDLDNMAAAIVDLGNSGTSTEPEIVDLALRIAGAGKNAGLSAAEILGFSAAVADAGIEAERGGTAIQKTLQDIATAVATGKDLQGFARIAGTTAKDFAKAFGDTPAQATARFVEGLKEIRKQAGPGGVLVALKAIGITESRQIDTLQRLSGAQGSLTEKLKQGTKAYIEGTAAQDEFDKFMQTHAATFDKLKTTFAELAISLGEKLLPILASKENIDAIRNIGESIGDLIEAFGKLSPGMQANIVKAFAIFAVGGPLIRGLGGITSLAGNLIGVFKGLGGAAGTAGGAKGVGGLLANMRGLQAIGNLTLTIAIAIIGQKTLQGLLGTISRIQEQGFANTLLPSWTDEGKHAAATLDDLTGQFGKLADAMHLSNEERFKVIGALSRESEANVKAAGRIGQAWGIIEAAVKGGADVPKLIQEIGEGADVTSVRAALLAGAFGGSAEKIKAALKDVASGVADTSATFKTASGEMVTAMSNAAGELSIKIADVNGDLVRMVPLDLADLGKKQFVEMAKALGIPLDAAERLRTKLQLLARDYEINVKINTILSGPDPTALGLPFSPGFVTPFHEGGYIPSMHRGGLRPDERLIKAQAGEFMMQRSAVNRIGIDNLERLNAGEALGASSSHPHDVNVYLDGKQLSAGVVAHVSRDSDRRRRARF